MIGAHMCPWTPQEFDGALTRIFAQDYALLAPSIDVFTPLLYGTKSGRPADWGRRWLEASPSFVPPTNRVQLILTLRRLATADRDGAIKRAKLGFTGLRRRGHLHRRRRRPTFSTNPPRHRGTAGRRIDMDNDFVF
ncbi:MAG: hypothetical protein R2873_32840 [Caldilineaceae bacterium]